jgi:hypothetical protein
MKSHVRRILVLCKTYPSPSAKYSETSCVAGMDESGQLIRLYPVPFRLIEDDKRFKKWQWISARLEKSSDQRQESHKIFVDTIQCDKDTLPTNNHWQSRRVWLDKLPVYDSFEALEAARQTDGVTLALLKPKRIAALEIRPVASPDWSEEEKDKLLKMQLQGDLFSEDERKSITQLRKLPYDFYYRYECDTAHGPIEHTHKIVDWEIGALYWNTHRKHGQGWEKPFSAKLEDELPANDLMFLMGTIHRFPDQWLIVSLIYPPRQRPEPVLQESLF